MHINWRSKLVNFILLIGIFFFFAIVVTYPAILHVSDRFIGDGGDNYQNLLFQFIASEKLKAFQYPFSHTDIIRYPVGFDFGAGSESVFTILIGATFSLFMNNISAYNLTVLVLFTLNGFFSWLLFRHLSKSYFLGVIGAIIYGYSSFVIARSAGHLNLFFIGALPLFIYGILRTIDSFKLKNVALVFLSATLILLGSFQYAILSILSLLICLPFLLYFFPDSFVSLVKKIDKQKFRIGLLFMPFFISALIASYSHLTAFLTGNYFKPDRTDRLSILQNSPSIKDFVLPNNYLPLQITHFFGSLNDSFKSIDRIVFIGWIELFLFVLFIALYKNQRLKYCILLLTSVFFILSLGFLNPETNIHLPYYFLHRIFPFSFIDEPARFFVIFYLFVTIAVILLLQQMNKGKTFLLFGLIIAIVISERLPFDYWLSPTFENDPFVRIVRQEKGEAVLDIPVSYYNSVYDILPLAYKKKVVSAPFQWFADTEKPKSFVKENGLTRFACGGTAQINNEFENVRLIQTLKKYGILTIVVHKNDPQDHAKYYFPECAPARIESSLLLPQLLMPYPTKEAQVVSLFFPVQPNYGDTITFAYDGIFSLEGFHVYPIDWLPLHLYLDDQEIQFEQKWTDRKEKNATSEPFLRIEVKKGQKMKFEFDKNQNSDYSFIKFWYRYESAEKNFSPVTINGITKLYEDDDAAVFIIQ